MTPCHVCVESKMRFPTDNLNIKKRRKSTLTEIKFNHFRAINVRLTAHFISTVEQVFEPILTQ